MSVTESGTPTANVSYSYDNLNRVLTETSNGVTHTYDNAISGAETAATYQYDANGNRISRTINGATDTYSYDTENRLIQLTQQTVTSQSPSTASGTYKYTYDYRTRRLTRDESQAHGVLTQLVFSGGTSAQEYSGPATLANLSAEFIRGSDYGGGVGGVLYSIRNGTDSFTHANRRGDIVSKTDVHGNVTFQSQYQAFGTQTATTGSTLDRQKDNSKDTDPWGGINDGLRYSTLEGGVRSFLTRDPAMFIDGPNMYSYVQQNPWTTFDPEGLFTGMELFPNGVPSNMEEIHDYNNANKPVAAVVVGTLATVATGGAAAPILGEATIGTALVSGAVGGATATATSNVLNGQPAGNGVAGAALQGAALNGAVQVIGNTFQAFNEGMQSAAAATPSTSAAATSAESSAAANSAVATTRPATEQPMGGNGTVLKTGEGATPEEMAASSGGPNGGSRQGQAKARQRLLDANAPGSPYSCWRCGQTSFNPDNMHLGHRNVPTSQGGNLSPENIALEGASCNLSAGNRTGPKPGMSCTSRGSCGAPYGRND